jgi:hypothetical protein
LPVKPRPWRHSAEPDSALVERGPATPTDEGSF